MPVELKPEDAPEYVKAFRKLVVCRDAQSEPQEKFRLDAAARMMREEWAMWKGEDTLWELAFGETQE